MCKIKYIKWHQFTHYTVCMCVCVVILTSMFPCSHGSCKFSCYWMSFLSPTAQLFPFKLRFPHNQACLGRLESKDTICMIVTLAYICHNVRCKEAVVHMCARSRDGFLLVSVYQHEREQTIIYSGV